MLYYMSIYKNILILITTMTIFTLTNCDIDPFAMEIDISNLHEKNLQLDCSAMNHIAVILYKRSLNMVLNLMKINEDNSIYNGQVYLTVSVDDFKFLKRFAVSKEDDIDLFHKADDILSKIYKKKIMTSMFDSLQFWFDNLYFQFFNRRTLIFVTLLIVLYIFYKLVNAKLTLFSIFKHLLFLAWIVDFLFVWLHLLQNAEINKVTDTLKYKDMPVECDPKKMSYWQAFLHSIRTTDECKQYYQTLMKDEFWTVSPFIVLGEQFKVLVKTPIISIGMALSEMVTGMSAMFPWYCIPIFVPMLLICFMCLCCIFLSFATSTPFGINLFALGSIHFGNKSKPGNNNILGGERPIIEEINLPNNRKHIKSKKKNQQRKIVIRPSDDTESEDTVNEEINVCILKKRKTSKKVENLVNYTPAIEDMNESDKGKDLPPSYTSVLNSDKSN